MYKIISTTSFSQLFIEGARAIDTDDTKKPADGKLIYFLNE